MDPFQIDTRPQPKLAVLQQKKYYENGSIYSKVKRVHAVKNMYAKELYNRIFVLSVKNEKETLYVTNAFKQTQHVK